MKKLYLILGAIVLALVVFGVYVKVEQSGPVLEDNSQSNLIHVTYPAPNDGIKSPIVVKGEARGNWYFEATFPIVIVDWDGKIIGQGQARATSDWMTTNFVPFEGTITFTKPADIKAGTVNEHGAVIFKKDNPSGDPAKEAAVEIPVVFQ